MAGDGLERRRSAVVIVEQDPEHLSVYGKAVDTARHAFYSAVVTLTLGVLGSTILPVPYAFSKLGVAAGAITMCIVAFANDRTCCMLVRASAATGRYGFEALSEWAGGKSMRVITQISLILLLYGTLCGGLAFLSDVARILVLKGIPPTIPTNTPPPAAHYSYDAAAAVGGGWWLDAVWGGGWRDSWWIQLARRDGRPLMLVVVAMVLYPLCLQRHIRQFEKAATVGVVVVIALMALIVIEAIRAGFPAIADGELPVWNLKPGGHAALPEAFAVLGFAFYMQPMLMPLLAEMPRGPLGVAVSERAVHLVLYGVAVGAYGTVGVFGASLFGDSTESNVMVNELLPGHPAATLVLYAALMVYLCCGMVTTQFALRASVEVLLWGDERPAWALGRWVTETTCILLAALAVACTFPTAAEKIFAVTGCTAVCLVCYCIPVYIHMVLRYRMKLASKGGPAVVLPYAHEAVQSAYSTPERSGSETPKPSLIITRVDRTWPAGDANGPGYMNAPGDGRDSPPALLVLPSPEAVQPLPPGASGPSFSGGSCMGALRQPLLPIDNGSTEEGQYGGGAGGARMSPGKGICRRCVEGVMDLALPVFIVAVGVGCSAAGLWVAATDLAKGLGG